MMRLKLVELHKAILRSIHGHVSRDCPILFIVDIETHRVRRREIAEDEFVWIGRHCFAHDAESDAAKKLLFDAVNAGR